MAKVSIKVTIDLTQQQLKAIKLCKRKQEASMRDTSASAASSVRVECSHIADIIHNQTTLQWLRDDLYWLSREVLQNRVSNIVDEEEEC